MTNLKIMKEISLNILDIAKNSVKAGASRISVIITEDEETLKLEISDDGCGMSPEMVQNVTDPFCTTRTTRKVGMGIPLLKLAAEQTGGSFSIASSDKPDDHGTVTSASFYKNHIDYTPLGDVVSTVTTLIQGSPDTDWYFLHRFTGSGKSVELDTSQLRAVLGEDVPLDSYEVLKWIEDSLNEEYSEANAD